MSFRYETNETIAAEPRFPPAQDRSVPAVDDTRHWVNPRGNEDGSPHALRTDAPNPFALVLQSHGPSAKSRFIRAIKTLLSTLALTAVLLCGVFYGKQFLLARLVAGFDKLESAAKQTRLIQIASFGGDAVPPLVSKLVDDEDAVSETAFTLLQQMQNDWITLPPDHSASMHARLIAAIERTYRTKLTASSLVSVSPVDVPPLGNALNVKQVSRARELVRQTILEFSAGDGVARDDPGVQQTLAAANRLLADLNVRRPANATLVGSGGKLGSGNLDALAPRTELSAAGEQSGWTDWPPPARSPNAQIVRSGPRESTTGLTPVDTNEAGLRVVPEGVTVPLSAVTSEATTETATPGQVVAARRPLGRVIQMTTHLSDSPMTVLDDETVIRHLANPDALLAGGARAELVSRGFSESQLETATAIAVAGPDDRIRLIDHFVHASGFDSGPWLSMLLDDPDRRVRLRVASAFAMTQDPAVLARLRQRLARENDTHVAVRLRRILDLD